MPPPAARPFKRHARGNGSHPGASAPFPLEKADQCCGFGGLFAVKFPQISGDMARDKAECISRTGASTLVCNDAGCALNIEGACRRQGVNVRVKSIAEIIAEGLGLLERTPPHERPGGPARP